MTSGDLGIGDITIGGHSGTSGTSDCESGSTEKCADRTVPFSMLERQGSFIHRERMIAHSTALESITMDTTAASSQYPGGGGAEQTTSGVQNRGKQSTHALV